MNLRKTIFSIIDFFYPPFKKFVPLKTFRYAACGGCNMVFDFILYAVFLKYVFTQASYSIWGITILAERLDYICVFPITFVSGFLLNRYIVFQDFTRRKHVQMGRYLLGVLLSFLLGYLQLKLYKDVMGLKPLISRIICYPVNIAFSYFFQMYFTFNGNNKTEQNNNDQEEQYSM